MTLPLWQKVSSAGKSSLGGGHSKLHVSRPYVANPFGYCMFEIVAHQPAYRAPDMTTLINKINPSSTSPLPTVYSPTLKRLIKSMLRKNPEHRPTVSFHRSIPIFRLCLDHGFVEGLIKEKKMIGCRAIEASPTTIPSSMPQLISYISSSEI
ncbi:serine/threonine-protein kinase Nek4-like isoform X2 [Actinidia eriantha]|uniref:serine/threonine-protein kinase Nek4-like isoform X2 n=1 Tax=Actinidia eriantha TaxID=165200 RepID=UPI002590F6DB|nr:serine/threonine-protein kinase Nek4-like isoform X2 [Actinidia eriantha]